MEGDTLLQLLGDDILGKIRRADLKKLKSGGNGQILRGEKQNPGSETPGKKKGLTIEDFRARNEKIKAGLEP